MGNNEKQSKDNGYILFLLTVCMAVALCLAYALTEYVPLSQSLKAFSQNILSNIIASIFIFITIYLFLTVRGLSVAGILGEQIGKNIDDKLELNSNELYRFYGLKGVQKESVYQNFAVARGRSHSRTGDLKNVNPVSFLWADVCYGNTINAEIVDLNSTSFLRVNFEISNAESFGCNIAIRPQNEEAIQWHPESHFLNLKIRIPSEVRGSEDLLKNIGISVRIVNGKYQHWSYARAAKECRKFLIREDEIGEWVPIEVDLEDKNNWHHFDSDGNQEASDKDLSIISCVILNFGGDVPTTIVNKFNAGKGMIDIGKIEFVTKGRSTTGRLA